MKKNRLREAHITRETSETRVDLRLTLDGRGKSDIQTGVGFFDHMLDHIARHGLFDLSVRAAGDLIIDPHHTVEDIGICLGQALRQSVGDGKGLTRYGHAVVPMDEALAEVSVDFSGRPFLVFKADLPSGSPGGFDAELGEEFFRAVAMNARISLHMELRYGRNMHHCLEGMFKAFGRAMRQSVALDSRTKEVPSTKGMLEL